MDGGTQIPEIAEFKVGSLIAGRYEICDHLGFGAMGLVLKVKDRALDDDLLALKILYPHLMADQITFSRFRNEVLIARKLTHPNIVRTYDIGRDKRGHYYISMEYVDGRTLDSMIYDEAHPMSFLEIVRILNDTAKGLQHAHDQGVVHRDLKPQNIMIAKDGTVKIADFGLAETLWMRKNLTRTGESVGTPYYMAPEQIQSDEIDHRADMYAFGIMAYEMVVHDRPFNDDNWFKMAAQHILEPLPEIVTENSNIPEWYPALVKTCAAKKRDDRFQNMGEIISVLEPVVSNTVLQSDFRPSASVVRQQVPQQSPLATASKGMIWFGGAALGVMLLMMLLFMAFPRDTQVKVALSLQQSGMSSRVFKKIFNIDAENSAEFFFKSVAAGDVNSVKSFLAENSSFDINTKNSEGDTALLLAIRNSDLELSKVLLGIRNIDPSYPDRQQHTPLTLSVIKQHPALVELLLSQRLSNIDLLDTSGNAAIHHATNWGNVGIIEGLLKTGADINNKNANGDTPLLLATRAGNEALVRLLVKNDYNADKLITDAKGKTALNVAKEVLPKESAVLGLLGEEEASNKTVLEQKTPTTEIGTTVSSKKPVLEIGRIKQSPASHNTIVSSVEVTNGGRESAKNISVNFPGAGKQFFPATGPTEIRPGERVTYKRLDNALHGRPIYQNPIIDCSNCR